MHAFRDLRAVRQRDAPCRQSLNDRLHSFLGIPRERIKSEYRFRGRRIDLPVEPDGQTKRVVDRLQQDLCAVAGRQRRVKQQQPALERNPATHVGDDELIVTRNLDD